MPVVITVISTVMLMMTMVTPTCVFLVTPARVASIPVVAPPLVVTPVTAILAKDSSSQRQNEYERKQRTKFLHRSTPYILLKGE